MILPIILATVIQYDFLNRPVPESDARRCAAEVEIPYASDNFSDAEWRQFQLASSDEPTPRKTHVGWGETVGIALGVVAGTVLSILLGAFGIHWILGLIKLGGLTYWQIVGLLAIWEMVKPTAHSK